MRTGLHLSAQRLALGVVGLTLAGLLGCPSEQSVLVRFQGQQPDALVTIDDRYVGKLEELVRRGIRVPAGTHRVTVEAVGFFPFDQLVELEAEPVELRVELVPIPD